MIVSKWPAWRGCMSNSSSPHSLSCKVLFPLFLIFWLLILRELCQDMLGQPVNFFHCHSVIHNCLTRWCGAFFGGRSCSGHSVTRHLWTSPEQYQLCIEVGILFVITIPITNSYAGAGHFAMQTLFYLTDCHHRHLCCFFPLAGKKYVNKVSSSSPLGDTNVLIRFFQPQEQEQQEPYTLHGNINNVPIIIRIKVMWGLLSY